MFLKMIVMRFSLEFFMYKIMKILHGSFELKSLCEPLLLMYVLCVRNKIIWLLLSYLPCFRDRRGIFIFHLCWRDKVDVSVFVNVLRHTGEVWRRDVMVAGRLRMFSCFCLLLPLFAETCDLTPRLVGRAVLSHMFTT